MTLVQALPALCLLLSLLGACRDADDPRELQPLASFDTARVQIVTASDTLSLRVEVAGTEEQRASGLMERPSLPADAGMLFTYTAEQPGDRGFWMYRTQIPLDIAFLDEEGQILVILAMEPCTSPDPQWCPGYPPGVPYHAALEVNQGYFARHGIGPGDRVVLPDLPRSAPQP
ncbi:MAG: DUF192 domain-containing protein [Longimicrobiaceae bacterium]